MELWIPRSKSIFGAHRDQTCSFWRVPHVVGSDGKVNIERNCVSLSPHDEKPQKGNKKCRTWTKKKSRKCFVFFGFLCLWTFVNVFRISTNMYISHTHIWLCNINSSSWLIDGILTDITTPSQSVSGNNGNERILNIPKDAGLEPHHQISLSHIPDSR